MSHGLPTAGATLYGKFTTTDGTGLPTTLAGSPVLSVYKDASLVEDIASITLTIDFDGRTGLNHWSIDTSSNPTFYANGNEYSVVITSGTVASSSVVGSVVDHFALTDLTTFGTTAAAIRAAVGLASANLDTQLAEIATDTDTTLTNDALILAAVANIAVTGAALNQTAASRTITSGSGSGGVGNTTGEDATYDNVADSAGALDFYYQFDISATTNAVGVGFQWQGYVVGVVNTIKVYAYNWGNTSWDQIGTVIGIAGTVNMTEEWEITSAHTQAGLVRLRFAATGLTGATIKTDRVLLGYAVTPPTVAAIQSGLATTAMLTDVQTDVDELQTTLADVQTDVDELQTTAITLATAATLADVQTDVDELQTTMATLATSSALATVAGNVTTIGGIVLDTQGHVDAIESTIGVAGAGLTAVGDTRLAHLDQDISTRATPAQVNAEVVDALNIDTYGEPGQETPGATVSLAYRLRWLYKLARNRLAKAPLETAVYNDAGTIIDQKSITSTVGDTENIGPFVSGP